MNKKLAFVLPIILIGCGGGGGGSSATESSSPPAAGIYSGTMGPSDSFVGIISPTGKTVFLDTSRLITFNFDAPVKSNAGSYEDAECHTTPPYGVTGCLGTANFTNVSVSGFTGTLSCPLLFGGTSTPFSLNSESSLYSVGASLTKLAGTYTGPGLNCANGESGNQQTLTLTFDSAGNITGSDYITSCTYSGAATIPSASANVYEISITPTCPGGTGPIAATGLAYLIPANTDGNASEQLFLGAYNGSGVYPVTPLTKQ